MKMLPAASLPLTDADDIIARMIDHANLPALMMAMMHISGDTALFDGPLKPKPPLVVGLQGGFNGEQRAAIKQQALTLLAQYRDRGCTLPPPPDRDTVYRMMCFMVGETVPIEFVDMFLEEMALDGNDARAVTLKKPLPANFKVVIIGAGMSGLLAAMRLQEAGIPYCIFEKNPEVGGTWFENSYPGCRVDVANHFYSYSFEPNHDWSEFFSQRDELLDYFRNVANKHSIRQHIRFNTEVTKSVYNEQTKSWQLTVKSADGNEEDFAANALISAVGQLNRAKWPDIDGIKSFRGEYCHSAQWNHNIDVTGKRVAVIGTGASAFQLIPKLAQQAKELFVFQRSPFWMMPNPSYHKQVGDDTKWTMKHVPYYSHWYRFLLFWIASDGLHPQLKVDPSWPHQQRSVNAANDATREFLTHNIAQQIGDRTDLLDKCIPSYPPFGKRMLQDNGAWFAALKRDNVRLVADPINKIYEQGVNFGANQNAEVDVIIYATGFHATQFLSPIEIVGKNNIVLNEMWGEDPAAYLGITIPEFPNLFCLYGPGTNLAHAGSIIFHSECQVRYVMNCLRAMIENNIAELECKPAVLKDWDNRLQHAMNGMVWSHPGMNNWYKNSKGRVVTTSPWRLVDYWNWTKQINLDDYETQ